MAMLGWALNLGFAAGASNAVTGTGAATLAAFTAAASGSITTTAQQGGHFLPFGAGIIPLRERIESVAEEIRAAEAAIAEIDLPDIDLTAIRDKVEREIAEALRLKASRDMARLERKLDELRRIRAWLLQLLEDAAAILLSAA